MRYADKTPNIGEHRVKRRFLWLPKTLYSSSLGANETRWLERTSWVQEFYNPAEGGFGDFSGGKAEWHDRCWLEKRKDICAAT